MYLVLWIEIFMNMKRILSFVLLIAILAIDRNTSAQTRSGRLANDIEAGIGIQGVPNSNNGVDMRLDLSYGYFFRNGMGFRAGATYTPQMLKVGKAIGAPISFAWRTSDLDKKYNDDRIDYDDYDSRYMLHQDYPDYVREQMVSGFARFLTNLASSIEVDAGVTPGYLSGKRADSFYLTGDIGLKTSWRIWRMNLSINPAMHYMLTDKIDMGKYKICLSQHERWQLSLVFGVSIML